MQLDNSLTLDRSSRAASQVCRRVSTNRESHNFPVHYGNNMQLYSTNQLQQRDNPLTSFSYDRVNAPMMANSIDIKSNSPSAWVSRSLSHNKKQGYSFNNADTPRGTRAVKYTFSQGSGCRTSKLNASAADLFAESVQDVPPTADSESLSKQNMQRVLALRALAVLKGASTLPPLEIDGNWDGSKSGGVANGAKGNYGMSRHHSYTQNRGKAGNLGRTPIWMSRNYSFTRSFSPSQQIQYPNGQFSALPISDVNNLSLFRPPRGVVGGSHNRALVGRREDICKMNAALMGNEANQGSNCIGTSFKVSGFNQPQPSQHAVSAGAFAGETQAQVIMNSQKHLKSKYASDFDWVLPPLTLPDPAYPGRDTYVSSDGSDESRTGSPIAGISGIWNNRSPRKMSEWSDSTDTETFHSTLTKLKRLWHDSDSKTGGDDFETTVFTGATADESQDFNEKILTENWDLLVEQAGMNNALSLTTVPETSLTQDRDGSSLVMSRGEHIHLDALRQPNCSVSTTETGGSLYLSGETRDGDEGHHRESVLLAQNERWRGNENLAGMSPSDKRSRSVLIAGEFSKEVPNLTEDLTSSARLEEELFQCETWERSRINVQQGGKMEDEAKDEARDGLIFSRGEVGHREEQKITRNNQVEDEEFGLRLDEQSPPPGLAFESNFFLGSNQQGSVVDEECFYTPNGADSRFGMREDVKEEPSDCESSKKFFMKQPMAEMYDNSEEFHEVISSISNLVCRQLDDSSTATSSRTVVAFEV